MTRREALCGCLAIATASGGCRSPVARPSVRFGLVTDCHYADREPNLPLNRHYRAAKDKLSACVAKMNELKPDFLIELGDFKDAGRDEAETLRFLDEIEGVFAGFAGPRYHVLGNHDADVISKEQFLSLVQNTGFAQATATYAFERKGVTFIVLDANFNADGTSYDHGNFNWREANVPPSHIDWLRRELQAARGPAVVFCHQRLDVDDHYAPQNVAAVRQVLEEAGGKVSAVFTGHHHCGARSVVNGIPYFTLPAVIDGASPADTAYALVTVGMDGTVSVEGFHKAQEVFKETL